MTSQGEAQVGCGTYSYNIEQPPKAAPKANKAVFIVWFVGKWIGAVSYVFYDEDINWEGGLDWDCGWDYYPNIKPPALLRDPKLFSFGPHGKRPEAGFE